ncbi:ATP-binding protein [Palleronia abyssalis]|uniref:ORC1/DEAH AAA+ ATPase domain-containing protein n=1 Tax=Palleronia abyssalis TaxID=1501240 RepID=A0A2R8C165_9RHOB|nr:ATP-binding protein [Palleronia abyssalis]SPJ26140.1 hypothetical protein PAA8504_03996 [Palleronia abyssalis]
MSNEFIIPSVAEANAKLGKCHFPLARGDDLHQSFAHAFSRHFGRLQAAESFDAHGLLVTGQSGTGKTTEIMKLISRFNESSVPLPNGNTARFVHCELDGKSTWKDLGRKTLKALGYPISDKTRRTQFEIWSLVAKQTELQGVIGIHYDEAQHIMRGKSDNEILSVLDAFKTLMKSDAWPLMLILSGIPELESYVRREPQLDRLLFRLEFGEIDLHSSSDGPSPDYSVLNEIVGSYAIKTGLHVEQSLMTGDFLHRLATAGAFRWGLVIYIVGEAISLSMTRESSRLEHRDFVSFWCRRTGMNELVTPFTHEAYERVFPKDQPYRSVMLP